MNIAELLHNEIDNQTISHWPVFSINQLKKSWYFYSNNGLSLRKKIQNTKITDFLHSHSITSNNNRQSESEQHVILVVKQPDRRQPKSGQLYQIKVSRITTNLIRYPKQVNQNSLIDINDWKPMINGQISLYKISRPSNNKLYRLQWSRNIVTCNGSITPYLRDKLSEYGQLICRKAQQKWLQNKRRIVQFQLIFTYDNIQGKVRIVFAHNFILADIQQNLSNNNANNVQKINEMFKTNFKLGADHYQCIEILMEQNKKQIISGIQDVIQTDSQPIFQTDFEQKRIQYLKLVEKLTADGAETVKICYPGNQIKSKKQSEVIPAQQFQCSCCNSCVVLKDFECKRMITSNRIHQVQILRQVKMKRKVGLSSEDYELVPVCELCYAQFKVVVESYQSKDSSQRQQNKSIKNQIKYAPKQQERVGCNLLYMGKVDNKRGNKIKYNTSQRSVQKSAQRPTSNLTKKDQHMTKAETTIRQDIQEIAKRSQHLVEVKKNRKSSLQINEIPLFVPCSQKTIASGIPQKSRKHNSFFAQKRDIASFSRGKQRREKDCKWDSRLDSLDGQTNDELSNAIAEYEQGGVGIVNEINRKRQEMRKDETRWRVCRLKKQV